MRKALLSTAEVAELFSVTETTVKRWADEGRLLCQKTPGGHRKFEAAKVMEFSNTYGLIPSGTLAATESEGLDPGLEVAVLARDFGRLTEYYLRHALSDERNVLPAFFSYLYHHHIELWQMFDLIIRPGMKEVGDLWKKGEVTIGLEHRASARTKEALSQIRSQIRSRQQPGRTALCACPDGTMHELGLYCAAIALSAEGWNVHYLGANTPLDSITELTEQLQPGLVCLSISAASLDPARGAEMRRMYRLVKKQGGALCIGGGGITADLFGPGECDRVLGSVRDLVRYAATLTDKNGAESKRKARQS